jgi:phosphoenolpyruvate synthase/pyruvate phosphate dikinase
MSGEPYVCGFDSVGLDDRARVGGKAASLGELSRAGQRVPAGFVITTRAFVEFLAAVDPGAELARLIEATAPDDLDAIARNATLARQRISAMQLPPALQDLIGAAYRDLRAGEAVTVAVRSSATSEDSADASFAGLQDTYLWIRDEATMLRAVRDCWASLYSVESVSYRRQRALPEQHIAMAVVVQRMVDARCAGVMFTRSPVTGDRSVIAIEGSWGLGSCIVSGEVTPDKFVVNKVTGQIVARTVSEKTTQHVPDQQAGGVRAEAVPAERQSQPCLTDDEIGALKRIAMTIERHYGVPQDIEWAIDSVSGELCVLQSRPETAWSNRSAPPVATPKPQAFDHVIGTLSGRRQ